MDEALAGVSIITMRSNMSSRNVSINVRNKSNIDVFAKNIIVLGTWYKRGTFLQLREGEQYVLEWKFNSISTLAVSDLVRNLIIYIHEDGLK